MNDRARMVLVVDDDPDILEIMAMVLEARGFRVKTARGGAEALRLIEDERDPPSLVLLDLMMPEVDGAQVLATMRAHARSTEHVVILSGAGDAAVQSAALGDVEYVPKPIDLDRLVALVGRHCP